MATRYGQPDALARHRAAAVAGQAAGLASEVARLKARFVIKDSDSSLRGVGVGDRKLNNADGGESFRPRLLQRSSNFRRAESPKDDSPGQAKHRGRRPG